MANELIWIPKRLVEVGLVNIAANSADSFVAYCEDAYEMRIKDCAQKIIESNAKIVMLTGPSASGKTTTSNKLAQQINGMNQKCCVISLDNFFKNIQDYPKLPNGKPDYESVYSLDIELINKCLTEIAFCGKTQIPEFDFHTEQRSNTVIDVEVGSGVLIIEGIHALNPILTHNLSKGSVYKVYAGLREEYSLNGQRILPTRDVRLARRMIRDILYRGHSIEKTMDMWPAVCEGEDKYIKIFKPEADLLLDTSFTYEICCIAPLILNLETGLTKQSIYYDSFISLCNRFKLCTPLSKNYIPLNSMLREFVG